MRNYLFAAVALSFALAGCGGTTGTIPVKPAPTTASTPASSRPAADEVAAERVKLPADERQQVEAQEWCAVLSDNCLGEMGKPEKIELDGKPVYLCCEGCIKKAKADPDATLAKVNQLKATKAAAK